MMMYDSDVIGGLIMSGIVYSVLMNKGGVGKTSLVTNLASALSIKDPDKKVLILDTDGQGNASLAFGRFPNEFKKTLIDCLVRSEDPNKVIINLSKNLDLLPSNDEMNYLEFDVLTDLKAYPDFFGLLKKVVDPLREKYDYIFIDSPPSMGLVAGNILSAADKVIIPYVPETFSVQGLIKVINTIEDFKKEQNVPVEIQAVVGMMVDNRTNIHGGLMLQADAYCKKQGILMAKNRIPKTIRFADATERYGMPITLAEKNNRATKVYFDLLSEVI